MNSQFKISSPKESSMNQDVLSSPGSGLYIEDREELNLGLLDESEEEEQVVTKISKLSDLISTDTTRKRRPILSDTEARSGGGSKSDRDPRLFNNRKLR